LKVTVLTVIRAAIGWHFLYEGLSKLLMEEWSSQSYLANAYGFLSGFYHWMAAGEGLVRVVDFLNVYGLILIGLALFLGMFIRLASGAGILLLVLYYFAYPPFGASLFGSMEGHFYIVNRNFIEAFLLLWFVISRQRGYGIAQWIRDRKKAGEGTVPDMQSSRREALKHLATLPILGAMGWGAFRHTSKDVDVMSGATIQLNFSTLDKLKGELPKGRIG